MNLGVNLLANFEQMDSNNLQKGQVITTGVYPKNFKVGLPFKIKHNSPSQ